LNLTQDLSEEELDYYSRQIVLTEMGIEGQKKLKGAKICVVGLGGLGSPVSIQLASMGVGHIRIVDRDIVENSNLQRQPLYDFDKVGYPKVEAAAERLRGLNPFIDVEPLPLSLNERNSERIIKGMDVVVDCLDSMTSRYALNRACIKLGIPLIFGAVITHIGNTTTIIPGKTVCLECFQGGMDDETLPSCALVGVHPSIIAIIASIQVSEAIRIILGRPPNLKNILLFCDLEDLSLERIELTKVETCPVCGSRPRSTPTPLKHQDVEEICGREGRRVFIFAQQEELELDISGVERHLEELGFTIEVGAELGLTFSLGSKRGSVLKSGVTILEGMETKDEANELYHKLLKSK